MNKFLLILSLLLLPFYTYAQIRDLIINQNNDSIICEIDSITSDQIMIRIKLNDRWTKTTIERNSVKNYFYDAIDVRMVTINSKSIIKIPKSKNRIYFEAMIGLQTLGSGLYYERQLFDFFSNQITFSTRIGIGSTTNARFYSGTLVTLIGSNKNRFETVVGVLSASYTENYLSMNSSVEPGGGNCWCGTASIGYRATPFHWLIIRSGINYPFELYGSLGVAF